jgi:hypothetical protein
MELRKVVLYMYNISFVKEFLRILTIYFWVWGIVELCKKIPCG